MRKTLHKLSFAALTLVGLNAGAQLPDNAIYPGGLVLQSYNASSTTELYPMGTWDIDSILDSGTPVILDLFATWCGPCWNFHTGGGTWGGVKNLSLLHANEAGDVFIAAVESDPSTANGLLETSSLGNWISGTPYVMAAHNTVADMMNLSYYPTIIMICPDRTVTEVGQTSAANYSTELDGCGAVTTASNDLRVTSHNTPATAVTCGGGNVNVDFEVVIQNYSTGTITGTKTVSVMNGMTLVGSSNVSVNLDPYEAMTAVVTVPLAAGTYNYTTVITDADDNLLNNGTSTPVTVSNAANVGTGDLVLHITMDAYAQEVGVLMASGLPYISDAAAAYSAGNSGSYTGLIDFQAIGTWPGNGSGQGTVRNLDWYGLAAGCYHFIMFDDYGDGLLGANGAIGGTGTSMDGAINLESESGYNGSFSISYGSMGVYAFEVTTAGDGGFTGIEEAVAVESASVYPNPANEMTNIEFNVTTTSEVTVTIMNSLGQIVYSNDMGEVNGAQKVQVNTNDFEAGMYLINITVNGDVITKRVSVVK